MPNKKPIIIIAVLSVLALGLGYWVGLPKDGSDERAEVVVPPAPTVVTNVVTNTLKEVVTNIVTVQPEPTPTNNAAKPVVKLTSREREIVGEYEVKGGKTTHKYNFLGDGTAVMLMHGVHRVMLKWTFYENEREIHLEGQAGSRRVAVINPNGSLTFIANINKDSTRIKIPLISQRTYAKVK